MSSALKSSEISHSDAVHMSSTAIFGDTSGIIIFPLKGQLWGVLVLLKLQVNSQKLGV